jgi:hypothetical protein
MAPLAQSSKKKQEYLNPLAAAALILKGRLLLPVRADGPTAADIAHPPGSAYGIGDRGFKQGREVRGCWEIRLSSPSAVVNLAGSAPGLPGSFPNFALSACGPGACGQFGAILIAQRPRSSDCIRSLARMGIPGSRERCSAACADGCRPSALRLCLINGGLIGGACERKTRQ